MRAEWKKLSKEFEYSYGKDVCKDTDFVAHENGDEGDAYRLANQIHKTLGVKN